LCWKTFARVTLFRKGCLITLEIAGEDHLAQDSVNDRNVCGKNSALFCGVKAWLNRAD
jgi:hypothetical protein